LKWYNRIEGSDFFLKKSFPKPAGSASRPSLRFKAFYAGLPETGSLQKALFTHKNRSLLRCLYACRGKRHPAGEFLCRTPFQWTVFLLFIAIYWQKKPTGGTACPEDHGGKRLTAGRVHGVI
jgi:hypothetical protein